MMQKIVIDLEKFNLLNDKKVVFKDLLFYEIYKQ